MLHEAAKDHGNGSLHVVRLLLAKGVDVSARDSNVSNEPSPTITPADKALHHVCNFASDNGMAAVVASWSRYQVAPHNALVYMSAWCKPAHLAPCALAATCVCVVTVLRFSRSTSVAGLCFKAHPCCIQLLFQHCSRFS